MLKSKSNWIYLDDEQSSTAKEEFKTSHIIEQLLNQRGLKTAEEMAQFLNPKIEHLIDPKNFNSIDRVKQRIDQAIEADEKILIYGDYDADGVTSTVILIQALRELGATCHYYIPNRFTEGYGPNKDAFKWAAKSGYGVIITVDTGIAAIDEADVAKALGIDLIITDHHAVQDELPDAFAIIHPDLSPDYEFKALAGVGIAFKLAEYLLGYFPNHLLDLAGIGTIADLVPLLFENRILAYFGLKQLQKTENIGLQALINVCRLNKPYDETDVGFALAPRINAVGRLQDASLAVELLLAETYDEAERIAYKIDALNTKRQQLVRDIQAEAESIVAEQPLPSFIVVAQEGWNEGVLGIVASRLVDTYDRPAIVLTIDSEKGLVKGSGRSLPNFNLFENLSEVSYLFEKFGGHSQAAGLTIRLEKLDELKQSLNDLVDKKLLPEELRQTIEINSILTPDQLTESLVKEINQLAPFGIGNPKPTFEMTSIPHDVRQIGQGKNHLKLQFPTANQSVEGIGFGMGTNYFYITPQTPLSIVGELNINEWNGYRTVQMIMDDMKIDDYQLFDHRGKKHRDLTPYVNQNHRQLCISKTGQSDGVVSTLEHITYDVFNEKLQPVDDLFIFDLPEQLEQLEKIVQQTQPTNIHACYIVENSVYLTPFPTRKDFKWLYAMISKKEILNLNEHITLIAKHKRWPIDLVQFMLDVFIDLKFVKQQDEIIFINPQPEKQPLDRSEVYQQRLKRKHIEKILYYSNYSELKEWLNECRHSHIAEEEIMNGL